MNDASAVNDWENPHVFGINKEPAHAYMVPYPSEELALRGQREATRPSSSASMCRGTCPSTTALYQ